MNQLSCLGSVCCKIMKARRSMGISHRHSFKYLSPVVAGKLYVKHGREDQENIPPSSMDASSIKRRKLYNGQAIVGGGLCQSMDMEISAATVVTTPKAYESPKFTFTPPNRPVQQHAGYGNYKFYHKTPLTPCCFPSLTGLCLRPDLRTRSLGRSRRLCVT